MLIPPTAMEATAIKSLSGHPDWKTLVDYLVRGQREFDVQLRAISADRLGKLQGASLVVQDLLQLPDTCRDVLKKPT